MEFTRVGLDARDCQLNKEKDGVGDGFGVCWESGISYIAPSKFIGS